MKVLFLAPQPFFTERGTPIAIRCLVAAFSRRGWQTDLLTFHEGADISCPNVTIIRTARLSWIKNIPPGFSLKKLVCDVLLFCKAVGLVRRGNYGYIHAVEESVFMAALLRAWFGIPFVYDMDSSMPEQLVEKKPALSFLLPSMRWVEALAVKRAAVVLPVCDALDEVARREGARRTMVLRDPPAFSDRGQAASVSVLQDFQGIARPCFMYIGNLEHYQGIDLLLQGFANASRKGMKAGLVIIGGVSGDIEKYSLMSRELGVAEAVRFLGPKPVDSVGAYVAMSDVLVSPRIAGVNTPMKIYAYLNSGKVILATDIKSHTQVLEPGFAVLATPTPEAFGEGMRRLASDSGLRNQLVEKATRVANEKYSAAAFEKTVFEFCGIMEAGNP